MIEVLKAGLFTTIQDLGRRGYRSYGIPTSGAMDQFACRTANMLALNRQDQAALEMTLSGGMFRFHCDAFAAIAGADMGCMLNGVSVDNWSSFYVPAGSVLAFSSAKKGCRSYLAVHGGVEGQGFLGSVSTYVRGGFGGLEGRQILQSDRINISPSQTIGSHKRVITLDEGILASVYIANPVRTMLGPQSYMFSEKGLRSFFSKVFKVSNRNDRMGYALEGTPIEREDRSELISEPVNPGVIQITASGMPIILTADSQSIGGYPKIAVVIGADLHLIAQKKAGDAIRFKLCTEDDALDALRLREDRLKEICNIVSLSV